MRKKKRERNASIIKRIEAGERMVDLAREYGITAGYVSNMFNRYLIRKRLGLKKYERRTEMALGPGKYDAFCTDVREKAKADGVIVIVLGGELGDGFSCQADFRTTRMLPAMLEHVAKQIRESGPFDD